MFRRLYACPTASICLSLQCLMLVGLLNAGGRPQDQIPGSSGAHPLQELDGKPKLTFCCPAFQSCQGQGAPEAPAAADTPDSQPKHFPTARCTALTRLSGATQGVKIMFIAGGPAATHCIAGDVHGRTFIWGRNERGQLGLGDLNNRNMPTLLHSLQNQFVIGGAAGRHHSVLVTREGEAFAMGLNTMGQCGIGQWRAGLARGRGIGKCAVWTSLTALRASNVAGRNLLNCSCRCRQ